MPAAEGRRRGGKTGRRPAAPTRPARTALLLGRGPGLVLAMILGMLLAVAFPALAGPAAEAPHEAEAPDARTRDAEARDAAAPGEPRPARLRGGDSEPGVTAGDAEPEAGPRAAFAEELSVTARAVASEGAAVTVIDREALDAANVRTVAEALRGIAGVQVLSFGTRAGRSTAWIRGGNPNFTLVLLDGIPLNDPMDAEGGTVNLESLSAAHVERIEVIRGPHSYYFGSSALAGVVNIVTRSGEAAGDAAGASGWEARAETGTASLLRAGASASGPAGRGHYYLGAGWEREEERVAEESLRQLDLHGKLTLPLGGASALRVTTRVTDRATRDYPEASGGPLFGSGELRDVDHRQVSLGALWTRDAGGRRHRLSAAVDRQDVAAESPGVAPLVPPSTEDRRFTRLRLGWSSRLELAAGLRLTGGAEVEREAADNRSTLLLPPFLGGPVAGDYALDRTTPAAFAELAFDRGPFRAEAGLRADLPEDLSTAWSPRLALSWRPSGGPVRLHGSWSEAFKLPSFFALASPPALGGNPDLVPEESTGTDLGVRWESASGDLSAGLTLFRNRYENLIDFDFGRFLHVNRSVVEAEGAELAVGWSPTPALTARADLTWQDLEDPASDRPLLNQPERIASVRLDWRATEALRAWLEGRYLGESLDVQIPVPDRTRVDDATLFDLALTWRWTRALEVEARVDNLTDEDHQQLIGFPQPGRSLRVGLRLEAGE